VSNGRSGPNRRRREYTGTQQRSSWKRPAQKTYAAREGVKRPRTWNESTESKKRQKKVEVDIPLSTILLATYGEKDSKLPGLIFGGFYECTRQAKLGTNNNVLRINVTRRKDQNSETVSIPVPVDAIREVSVVSGMNRFEELLMAPSKQDTLLASIERLSNTIEKREGIYAKKMEELELMPVFEDEEGDNCEEETVKENNADEEEADITDQQQDMETEKEEREQKREERRLLEIAIQKMEASLEKSRMTLAMEQDKLAKIEEDFGEQLALFQDETDSSKAESIFIEELQKKETVSECAVTQEKDTDGTVDAKPDQSEEKFEVDRNLEDKVVNMESDTNAVQDDTEMTETKTASINCTACGAQGVENKKFCGECGAKQCEEEAVKTVNKFKQITEPPVWVILVLKKPLEKFYATDRDTSICSKDTLEKASMIVLGYNPEKISSAHLRALNDVLEGPWKAIRRVPEHTPSDCPYPLEKTLQYLVKLHKRQEVSDNILETCQLCGSSIKRMHMAKHVKEICMMREEPCPYCGAVFVMKNMEEHHQSDCPKFPIPCPQKCGIAKFARSDVEEHFKVCRNSLVDCEYKVFGCDKKVKRREVPRHLKEAAVDHVGLLEKRLKLMTDYLLKQDEQLVKVLYPAVQNPENHATKETMETEE